MDINKLIDCSIEVMLHEHKIAQSMSKNKTQHSNHLMRQINMHHYIKDLPPKKTQVHRRLRKKVKRRSVTEQQDHPFHQHLEDITLIQRSGTAKADRYTHQIKSRGDSCKKEWEKFQKRVDNKTRTSLKEMRNKAQTIKQRLASSTVWIQGGVNLKAKTETEHPIAKEPINELWHFMRGTDPDQKMFRMRDLESDVNNSVVLSNAYAVCQKSAPVSPPKKQRFETFVYLRQNQDRLPSQKYQKLLRDNYLQS